MNGSSRGPKFPRLGRPPDPDKFVRVTAQVRQRDREKLESDAEKSGKTFAEFVREKLTTFTKKAGN